MNSPPKDSRHQFGVWYDANVEVLALWKSNRSSLEAAWLEAIRLAAPPLEGALIERLIESALDSDASGRPDASLADIALELRALRDGASASSDSKGTHP
jgi:hypothetical protein